MKRIVLMTGMLFVGSMVVAKPLEYAKWISDGKPQPTSDEACYLEDPAPIFKKTFQIHKEECSVELHIAALGLYRAELNGKPVGNAVLAPLWTPFNERILFDTYDIKNLLVQGENTLTITLGNGWYNPLPLRLWGHINVRANVAVGRPALAAEVELTHSSGPVMAFQTDGTWQVAETPLLRNNLYLGEVYDARRTIGEWRSVTIVTNPPKGVLERRSAPPVVEIATWPSVKVTPLEPQKQVVDMGRNFSGVATFRLGKGPAGERITFRYGELLNTNGTVNFDRPTGLCGNINHVNTRRVRQNRASQHLNYQR